jgi:hypothetical protein
MYDNIFLPLQGQVLILNGINEFVVPIIFYYLLGSILSEIE